MKQIEPWKEKERETERKIYAGTLKAEFLVGFPVLGESLLSSVPSTVRAMAQSDRPA